MHDQISYEIVRLILTQSSCLVASARVLFKNKMMLGLVRIYDPLKARRKQHFIAQYFSWVEVKKPCNITMAVVSLWQTVLMTFA